MIYNIYSVRDVKTSFASPFIDQTDDSAARGFSFAFSNNGNVMSFAPEDFALYCLGTFNPETGEITPCLPRFVVGAPFKDGVSSAS